MAVDLVGISAAGLTRYVDLRSGRCSLPSVKCDDHVFAIRIDVTGSRNSTSSGLSKLLVRLEVGSYYWPRGTQKPIEFPLLVLVVVGGHPTAGKVARVFFLSGSRRYCVGNMRGWSVELWLYCGCSAVVVRLK